MAIYRCEFKIYSRGKAHSAAAASAYVTGTAQKGRGGNAGKVKLVSAMEAAAYRSGDRLTDHATEQTFDYSGKHGVVWSGILAPDHAPAWAHDRAQLWREVEKKEDASTRPESAQLFRECLLTLPRELNREQQVALVKDFVRDQFVSEGMVADIGIHAPDGSDGREQPHAHIMLTLRKIGPEGFGNKNREWNGVNFTQGERDGVKFKRGLSHQEDASKGRKDGFLRQRRASWEDYCNAALADAGSTARIDCRSLKARGIDQVPQPKLGKAKYARPAPWRDGVREKAEDVRVLNRAARVGRAASLAFRRGVHMQASRIAADALADAGDAFAPLQAEARTTARLIGGGIERPDHDLWGYDV